MSHFSSVEAPFTDLTKKAGQDPVEWMVDCTQTFQSLKELLCTRSILVAPGYAKTFILRSDASQSWIRAIQLRDDDAGTDHPLAFYSRKMFLGSKTTWRQSKRVWWWWMRASISLPAQLPLHHSNGSLCLGLSEQLETTNGHLVRWMDVLHQLDYKIIYRQGKANANADSPDRNGQTNHRLSPQ